MTGLVVGASVALRWLIEEEGSNAALALQGQDLAAPALLRLEAANVFRMLVARGSWLVARGDLAAQTAVDLFALLQEAPVTIVDPDDGLERRALDLALQFAHPLYDCVYLALAERMDRTLITADRRFLATARRSGLRADRVALLEDWGA
jgi:predicted nucleic acid-binding protein